MGGLPIQKDDDQELIEVEIPQEEAALIEELNEVKELNEDYLSRLQRLQADFENFRRRTRIHNEELSKYASFEIIKELLSVSDNLQRATEALKVEKAEGTFEGIQLVHKQLCDVLRKNGVTGIKSIGELFDPHIHEAVMSTNDEELPDNIIVEEIQTGYKLHDKVLRPSIVKVNKNQG